LNGQTNRDEVGHTKPIVGVRTGSGGPSFFQKGFIESLLCLYPVKPTNGHLRHFSFLKISQLNLIIGNDRPQVITSLNSKTERFVIQTNGSSKTFNNLCPVLKLVSQISRKEMVILLHDSNIEDSVFCQFGGPVYFTIPTLQTSPFS
jgi:hypothetical protein